jgi:hypothetical protein
LIQDYRVKLFFHPGQCLRKRAFAFLRVRVELCDREWVVRAFVPSHDSEDELPDLLAAVTRIRNEKILTVGSLRRDFDNAESLRSVFTHW